MVLSLTWGEKDRAAHGACGPALRDIVAYSLPRAKRAAPAEGAPLGGDRHGVLFDPAIPFVQTIQGLPPGETGHAVEFTQRTRRIPRREARPLLIAHFEKEAPADLPDRQRRIEAHVDEVFHPKGLDGYHWLGELFVNSGRISRQERQFVRWLSRDEFAGLVAEAQAAELRGNSRATTVHRWYGLLTREQQLENCERCPFSTVTTNPKTGQHGRPGCYRFSQEGHFTKWIEFVTSRVGALSVLTEQRLHDRVDVAVDELPLLEADLRKSREVLERDEISAFVALTKDGKIVRAIANDDGFVMGDRQYGYIVSFGGPDSLIQVEYRHPYVPVAVPTGNVVERSVLRDYEPMSFISLHRDGTTYQGRTASGQWIELPPIEVDGERHTPFSFADTREAEVNSVEYTRVPAVEAWGTLQRWFERYLAIAQAHSLPILLGH